MDFDPNFYKNNAPEDVISYLPKPVVKEKQKGILASAGEFLGDMGDVYGTGAGALVKGIGSFGPKDNIVSEIGQDAIDYWQAQRSNTQKASDAKFEEVLQDPNKDWTDVVGHLAMNPRQLAAQATQSLPAMAVGMGAGGIIAKGMVKAGLMLDAAGNLTAVGGRVAAGAGEGLAMAPDINEATKGAHAGESTLAGIALGIATNVITPGSPVTSAVRRMSGGAVNLAEDSVANFANKAAWRRGVTGIIAEGAQEATQEFSQALIEQGLGAAPISGNDLGKRVAVAGMLGGVMGGGLHPVTGEGAPRFQTQDERNAFFDRQKTINVLSEKAQLYQQQAENSSDPLILAKANAAQAELAHAVAPTPQTEAALNVANAVLQSKLNPASQSAKDAADMARGEAVVAANPDPVVIRDALHQVTSTGMQNVLDAPTDNNSIDASLDVYRHTQDAAPAVSTIPASISALHTGVATAENTLAAEEQNISDEAGTPEWETLEQEQKRVAREADEARKAEKHRLQMEIQQVRLQREQAKTATMAPTESAPSQPLSVQQAREAWIQDTMQPSERGQLTREQAEQQAYLFERSTFNHESMARDASGFYGRTAVNYAQALLNQGQVAPAEQAGARTPLEQARGDGGVEEINMPDVGGFTIADDPQHVGTYHVLHPNGDVYDSYTGQNAKEDAKAAVEFLNKQDHEQATSAPMPLSPEEQALANARQAYIRHRKDNASDSELEANEAANRLSTTTDDQLERMGRAGSTYIQPVRDYVNAILAHRAAANSVGDENINDESPRTVAAIEDALAAGISAHRLEQMQEMTIGELKEEFNDILNTPEERKVAHSLLLDGGVESSMITAEQFDAREELYQQGLSGASLQDTNVVRQRLEGAEDSALRDWASGRVPSSTANVQLSNFALALRQRVHLGQVDTDRVAGTNTISPISTTMTSMQRDIFNNAIEALAAEEGMSAEEVSNRFENITDADVQNLANLEDDRSALNENGIRDVARYTAILRNLPRTWLGSNVTPTTSTRAFDFADSTQRPAPATPPAPSAEETAQRALAAAQNDPVATARERYIATRQANGASQSEAKLAVRYYEGRTDSQLAQELRSTNVSEAAYPFIEALQRSRGTQPRYTSAPISAARQQFISAVVARGVSRQNAEGTALAVERLSDSQLTNLTSSGGAETQDFARAVLDERARNAAPTATLQRTGDEVAAAALGLARQQYIDARRAAPFNIGQSEAENAARHYEGRSDSQLTQDLTGSISDAAREFIRQLQRIRQIPGQTPRAAGVSSSRSTSSTNAPTTPTNTVGVRNVTHAFEGRAQALLSSGGIEKIADFFKTVMRGRGQRVLKAIKIDDLFTSFREAVRTDQQLPADGLQKIQDRYNEQLKKQAKRWAEAHNETFDENAWVDPIKNIRPSSSRGRSAGFYLEIAGLNRPDSNENPYMKNPAVPFVGFSADSGIHAVNLRDSKGSGELAYRIAGDVAQARGYGFPSDGTLLTVNNYRRAVQTLNATALGDANAINPMVSSGSRGQQGMPANLWRLANENQRVGLNVLRFAHSTTEARDMNGTDDRTPTAKIFENLEYKSDGKIYAITNPRFARGFPKSDQPITEAQLSAKISEVDENGRRAFTQDSGYGGVGISSAKFAIMLNTAINFAEQNPGEDIPAWMTTVAKQAGREAGGWLFSESDLESATTGQPITQEEATSRINEMVGESVGKVLLESGLINFVQTQEELTGETFSDSGGRIQGATSPEGKITLVLDNLHSGNFNGVVQHEALHATLKALVGQSTYDALMSRLSTLLQAGKGSNWATEAEARVPTNTSDENHLEEVAAYAIEQAANGTKESNPLIAWAKNFMSSLRSAIIRSNLVPESLRTWAIKNLQAADLQKLAVAGLKAKGEGLLGETATGAAMSQGASYGTPTEGAVSVQGVHYTNEERTTLDTNKYGQGIKGEEAERLAGEENSDIRPRTHFYVDQGGGVEKEAGLGAHGHMTTLNNMYDAALDPLNLRMTDANGFERAVVKAGFDGFYDAKNGNAVVLGDHTIPVEKYVPGTNVSEPYVPKVDTFRENLQKSSFPGGQMLGREWSVALKGTEFDTSQVRTALKAHAGEMIYRDDIPRFNDGTRFSIAEEIEANQAPVDEAHPNETNILANNRRGIGGMIERFVVKPFQNKHETIRRIQRILGVTKENVDMHVMGALNRMGSRVQTEQERLIKHPFARIEAILNDANFSGDAGLLAMKDYLINNHVTEYNENVMIVNPARYDAAGIYLGGFDQEHPASGIKSDVAQSAVALVHERAEMGDKRAEAVIAAAKVYREAIHGIQDYAVKSGLQKQEVIDVWNKQNPNYVPFIRELGDKEDYTVGMGGGGSGLSTKAGISKRAMGSSAEIVHPLVSTAAFGARTVVRGENAEVGRALLTFAKNFVPNFMKSDGTLAPMWSVDKTQNIRVIKRTNVYRVRLADGTQSPEFYNRSQAQNFANAKEQAWRAQNTTGSSGIIVDQIGNGAQPRTFVVPQPNNLNAENVVTVPVKGETHFITFAENSADAMSIAQAMRGGNHMSDAARIVLAPFRMFSHWISTTATGKNPAFMPFNSMYDVTSAMINAGSEKIPGWTAKDSLKIATGFAPAMSQIWKHLREEFVAEHTNGVARPVPKPGSMAEWVDIAREAGGLTGIVDSNFDLEDHETQLRRLMGATRLSRPLAPDEVNNYLRKGEAMLAKIGDSFYRFGEGEINTKSAVFNWLSKRVVAGVGRMNEAAELATRTLAFKLAVEKYEKAGKTREEALNLAAVFSKNISTNFQNKGSVSGVMNSLFPFFNASMQGSARLGESLFEKGTFTKEVNGKVMTDERAKLSKFGKAVGASTLFAGIAQALLLAASGYDDDDIPKQVKDRSFVVPIGDNKHVLLPLPHGFRTIVGFGREMTDAVLFHDKALAHIGAATFGQIAGFSPTGSAGNFITDLTPALIDPFFSLASNTDAFGRPISKLPPDPAHPTPGFTRAKEGASKFGRATSEFLNTLTGGNDYKSGAMSPTPDDIDFIMGTLTGGVGKFAAGTAGLIAAGANDLVGNPRENIPLHKIPLVNRLYGDLNAPAAIHDKLFRVRSELNMLDAERKGLFKSGDREAALALIEEHPEMQLHGQLEAFVRRDATQRKNRATARGADEIEKVNAITSKQDARILELLNRYDEIKERQSK